LPLFVDSGSNNTSFTDSLDGTAQRRGFASRIVVNSGLLTDSSYLSVYQSPANAASDPTRPTDLIQRLEKTGVTSSAQAELGLAGTRIPIGQLLRQTVQANADEVKRVIASNDNQTLIQNAIDSKFTKASGVNMDKELSDMTQLQNAYTANARVLTAVKDMFDVLMRL
jgi:flagellar hook-associated protein 1 FlgK